MGSNNKTILKRGRGRSDVIKLYTKDLPGEKYL